MKIGLISVYFGLFDEALPPTFRKERTELNKTIEKGLSVYGKLVNPGLVDNENSAKLANKLYIKEGVDVLVYAPTMAAPPVYLEKCIQNINTPLMCISPQEFYTTPKDYDTDTGTKHSTLVGLTMGTNILVREGRPFEVEVLHIDEISSSKNLEDFFKAVGDKNLRQAIENEEKEEVVIGEEKKEVSEAVNALRNSPLIALGNPISGYLDVELTDEDAELLGIEIKKITKEELNKTFNQIEDDDTKDLMKKINDKFTHGRKVDNAVLEQSCKLSLAMKRITEDNHAIGGTINCHGDFFRWNDKVGITGCLGVSCLAEEGKLFSCTGDIPASIALIAAKIISGSALYCECYTIDFENNTILIANGGEGDFTINNESPNLRILPEDHYMGDNGPGVAVQFDIKEMDATLISITPTFINNKNEWRIILAEGIALDSKHPNMEGPNTMFKFNSKSAKKSFEDWARLGASHHAILMPGHQKKPFKSFSDSMNIRLEIVT
tara:strand:- start:720 stop:2201 length:1482 start_codon:yes stop_codon:yes gene_type:complete